MRRSLLLLAFLIGLLTLNGISAQAQAVYASSSAYTPRSASAPREDGATRTFIGRVVNPDGALPGAVITVAGTKEMAVSNSNGEFSVLLPATSSPIKLTVSYGGFADETVSVLPDSPDTTLRLASPQPIKVGRKQELKAYMKTAHREVRRSLRRL
ncbi:carboxypeptidase-like regulatory domain-containing protein [Hymenobacter properus]|uniref:Carboxypeptidase regulatory-like domain-containing protein n=1 Tax=Hymenobacter properus TaxID=2791026 RepID=A0A931BCE1_9BACT|nr:carboxypeptidase-like regulatory domain-containing protein [Hymenobacter properus]MBF9141219.1 carboxypeptidase regulatory-like domain-containing protein [Hymenobacter properus]MBR7720028.1 carboxypeptidase regulatory-like domain-containing protein [Microvirga sp. SRT04]